MFNKSEITINYRRVDEWHVFNCPDLPGLLVVSKDKTLCEQDLPGAIEQLLLLDENIKCRATPLPSLYFYSTLWYNKHIPTETESDLNVHNSIRFSITYSTSSNERIVENESSGK